MLRAKIAAYLRSRRLSCLPLPMINPLNLLTRILATLLKQTKTPTWHTLRRTRAATGPTTTRRIPVAETRATMAMVKSKATTTSSRSSCSNSQYKSHKSRMDTQPRPPKKFAADLSFDLPYRRTSSDPRTWAQEPTTIAPTGTSLAPPT